jgi:hypothetical protein
MAKKLLRNASVDPERHCERTDLGRFSLGGTLAVIPATPPIKRTPSMIVMVRTNPLTSLQMKAMVDLVETIWEQEKLTATSASCVVEFLWLEDRDFHSPDPLPEDSWGWRKTKIRLIYAHTVKINSAFHKRAERYVRKTLDYFLMYEAHAALVKRKYSVQGAKAHS